MYFLRGYFGTYFLLDANKRGQIMNGLMRLPDEAVIEVHQL